MNKEKFINLANLYLMNELDENKKVEFENIVRNNPEFYDELEKLRKLHEIIINNSPVPKAWIPQNADEELLSAARSSLLTTLRSEAKKKSAVKKIIEWIKVLFIWNYGISQIYSRYKLALGGISMLLIGFCLGYYYTATSKKPMIEISRSIDKAMDTQILDDIKKSEIKISNIRLLPTAGIPKNSNLENAEIEIMFDEIKPVIYKGSLNDPVVQRLLARALITENNPGVRIRTINTLASQTELQQFTPDPKVKAALITTLKIDDNPAVRREALNLLMKFPFDDEIRDAYLFVLSNDSNSGLRVAAINALAQLKIQGNSLDEKIINVLNKKAEFDRNDFVRLRATSLVKEVN